MDFKELIKNQLEILKSLGKSRRDIEKDLNYQPKYLDQALAKGGNKRLLQSLKKYTSEIEKNSTLQNEKSDSWEPPADDLIGDRIVLKTVVNHILKIEAVLYNRSLEDVRRDFKLDTSLLFDQLADDGSSKP